MELVITNSFGSPLVVPSSVSPLDWIILAVIALVIFGPKKLLKLGKQMGHAVKEISQLRDDFWR